MNDDGDDERNDDVNDIRKDVRSYIRNNNEYEIWNDGGNEKNNKVEMT